MARTSLYVLIANRNTGEAQKLGKFLHRYDRNIHIVDNPSTIQDTIQHFHRQSPRIDLAFFETRLSDGSTFEIFNQTNIKSPVVFTSSSKTDAFEAIKFSGVDYLLEPLTFKDVALAMDKVMQRNTLLGELATTPSRGPNLYKKRFMVKFGDKIQYKTTEEISYIFAEGKMVYIVTRSANRKYIIEHTLDELEKKFLDPECFYRINRKYIVHISVIEEVRNYVNSRLKLILNPPTDLDMIVSREKVHDFKNWLNL